MKNRHGNFTLLFSLILGGLALSAIAFAPPPDPPPANNWRGTAQYLKTVDNVTQASSITTAVEIDARIGTITTVSATTPTNAKQSFQVDYAESDTTLDSNSKIILQADYGGSSGYPYVYVSGRTDTSFTCNLVALQDTLNAAVRVHYWVVN